MQEDLSYQWLKFRLQAHDADEQAHRLFEIGATGVNIVNVADIECTVGLG